MISDNQQMYPLLEGYIYDIRSTTIPHDRQQSLGILIDYIQSRINSQAPIHLNFICTHNSRRSQFAQIWAQVAGIYYQIQAHCYSGGIEVTACNERTISALSRAGFHITAIGLENPKYTVSFSPHHATGILLFSKLYSDPINPRDSFAAVMTCAEADNNCPFIPGTEKRISITYEDPKISDGTPLEHHVYDERCKQIAAEMFYVFSRLNQLN